MPTPKANPDPIAALARAGQSPWYDGLRRELIASGGLAKLVAGGVRGMTTNPAIYEKAIAETRDYDAELLPLLERGLGAEAAYEEMAVHDIQAAADVLRPVYRRTRRRDGYVSLEVSPEVARDRNRTLDEARRLWGRVGRENAMIKVPGTHEGIEAFRQLVDEGVNVNVTLLFSQEVYEQVVEAWLDGLSARAARDADVSRNASVASFFVSRVDTLVDGLLEEKAKGAVSPEERSRIEALLGRAAVANAKLAYERYLARIASPRWARLAARGARPQRLLWASTSTKNPRYRDVAYVEQLIGADTVDTMPPQTLEAFRDHGRVRRTLTEGVDEAREVLRAIEALGISMEAATGRVLEEGLRLFAEPYRKLLATIELKREAAGGAHP
jgi:transaldolase